MIKWWKNTKLMLLVGIIFAFVSLLLIVSIVMLGRLDIGDKWFDWKDDSLIIVMCITMAFMIMSYIVLLSVGIDANADKRVAQEVAEREKKIQILQIELDEIKK
ncbi:MAG: hypothetical protein GY853_16065 [PVC group bacterium]|nr:hypothetical protein [PVC group bacterium]